MTGRGRSGRALRRAHGGCLLKLMLLAVVAGAVVSLAWMALLPVLFTRAVRERTGFGAEVASLSANPFTGRVTLRGLVLTNPPAFPGADFLQLRALEAEVGTGSLLGDRLEIDTLALDLRQLTLVKRADGRTNVDTLRMAVAGPAAAPGAKPTWLIGRLRVRCDALVLADYTAAPSRIRTYRLGLDRQFTNVSGLAQLLAPAVVRELKERDAATGLAEFLPADLRGLPGDSGQADAGRPQAAERKSEGFFRRPLDKLEETRKP
jgi:hypothetical protein